MKRIIVLIYICLLFAHNLNGQNNNNPFVIDEYSLSFNRTVFIDDNTSNRIGFGLGVFRNFTPDRKQNIIFGLEHNYTSQKKELIYESRYTYVRDAIYNINNISFPLSLRFNPRKNNKMFLECGIFGELLIHSNRVGVLHQYNYNPDNRTYTIKEPKQIDESIKLSDNYGMSLGIGSKLPLSLENHNLIIRADVKFGFNQLNTYHDDIYNYYFRISLGLIRNN